MNDFSSVLTSKPVIGTPIMDFTMTLYKGASKISRQSSMGKLVLLEFWTFCSPCFAPILGDLHEKHHSSGLQIISANVNQSLRELAEFLTPNPSVDFVITQGNASLAETWGIKIFPTLILIDRKGVV